MLTVRSIVVVSSLHNEWRAISGSHTSLLLYATILYCFLIIRRRVISESAHAYDARAEAVQRSARRLPTALLGVHTCIPLYHILSSFTAHYLKHHYLLLFSLRRPIRTYFLYPDQRSNKIKHVTLINACNVYSIFPRHCRLIICNSEYVLIFQVV